jgi:hypothetical protein
MLTMVCRFQEQPLRKVSSQWLSLDGFVFTSASEEVP